MENKRINDYVGECHENAVEKGFYEDYADMLVAVHKADLFEKINERFVATELMQIVSECTEALEAREKGDSEAFNQELADIAIRLFSFAGFMAIDLEAEIDRKMEKNKTRPYKHWKRF